MSTTPSEEPEAKPSPPAQDRPAPSRWRAILVVLVILGAIAFGARRLLRPSTVSGPTGDGLALSECKALMEKMEACAARHPTLRSEIEAGLKDTRASWANAVARGGPAEEALRQGCAGALASFPPTCDPLTRTER